MQNLLMVIPAIKKSAVIPDQLVKKLNGKTLIQRAIDISKKITHNILVITDSEEIGLICERDGVDFFKDSKLKIDSSNILNKIENIIKNRVEDNIIIYRANAPLVDENILKSAYKEFLKDSNSILISVKRLDKQLLHFKDGSLVKIDDDYFKELKAFLIFNKNSKKIYRPFIIDNESSIEIETYQDWWVCEKLLQRKRVVFNVIGNVKVGMGHIYRALSLAHEITDHEIIFVCHQKDELAVEKIASKDYKVIPTKDVKKTILELNPDILINDVLNTKKEFILSLKNKGIKIVNFEDMGEGCKYADMVFNELYDEPILEYKNIFWGSDYYFLRDEFETAKTNGFSKIVRKLLVTFGGTDQHNITLKTLKNIANISKNIKIEIVCGGGYLHKEELDKFINTHKDRDIDVTFQTGVISKKMEKCDLAITSNGRTVYELAHMHIPSIVISQHEREKTHNFSKLENGFINIGSINDANIDKNIKKYTLKMISDSEYRYLLYLNTLKFNFLKNKKKVVKKIVSLIEN